MVLRPRKDISWDEHEFEAVVAFRAREDTFSFPWIHLQKCKQSAKQVQTAHEEGKGFFRAISHPFLVNRKSAELQVEVKWWGFNDKTFHIMPFLDICQQFSRHPAFWEFVTYWMKEEENPHILTIMADKLDDLPVRSPL